MSIAFCKVSYNLMFEIGSLIDFRSLTSELACWFAKKIITFSAFSSV